MGKGETLESKEKEILVSIVTPSYNQGRFIEDTILSVKNQDYLNIEHIVVDGKSTDNTLKILKKYGGTYNMSWISEPDEGQSDAVNKGFEMAKGEVIGWLNSDDVYFYKDVIFYIVNQFKTLQDVDVIYGDDVFIGKDGTILSVNRVPNWNYNRLLRGRSLPQPATFLRRNVILENPINEKLKYSMDLELWLRLGKNYNFYHVKRILAGNRFHKETKSIANRDLQKKEHRKVIEEYRQKFGLEYCLYNFTDKLSTGFRRLLAISDILKITPDDMAFRAEIKSKIVRIKSQLFPSHSYKR